MKLFQATSRLTFWCWPWPFDPRWLKRNSGHSPDFESSGIRNYWLLSTKQTSESRNYSLLKQKDMLSFKSKFQESDKQASRISKSWNLFQEPSESPGDLKWLFVFFFCQTSLQVSYCCQKPLPTEKSAGIELNAIIYSFADPVWWLLSFKFLIYPDRIQYLTGRSPVKGAIYCLPTLKSWNVYPDFLVTY